jgi:AmmeMemoRadiSam system protein B
LTVKLLGPAVAGTWYPASPVALAEQLDELLGPPVERRSRLRALIAPHAGYRYSGKVAAAAFRLLWKARFREVLLIGPSHHFAYSGAALPSAAGYRTPLGSVPIATEVVRELGERPGVMIDDGPFEKEHALEAELPFLQHVLAEGWRLVPMLIGSGSSDDDVERIVRALDDRVGPATLVVVSSDFTHYGPSFRYVPFKDDLPRKLDALDRGAFEPLLAGDRVAFTEYVQSTGATICGRQAIEVLLGILPEPFCGSLVAYDTSGRITGSWDHSVSYAALAFTEELNC